MEKYSVQFRVSDPVKNSKISYVLLNHLRKDLPLQSVQEVNVHRGCIPVDHGKNGQSNSHFRCSHGHNEKNENLSCSIRQVSGKSSQEQVHGIQHKFNAHENDDGISTEKHAKYSDAEQKCAQQIGRAHV